MSFSGGTGSGDNSQKDREAKKVKFSDIKCALDFPCKKANLRLVPLHGFGGCAMLG